MSYLAQSISRGLQTVHMLPFLHSPGTSPPTVSSTVHSSSHPSLLAAPQAHWVLPPQAFALALLSPWNTKKSSGLLLYFLRSPNCHPISEAFPNHPISKSNDVPFFSPPPAHTPSLVPFPSPGLVFSIVLLTSQPTLHLLMHFLLSPTKTQAPSWKRICNSDGFNSARCNVICSIVSDKTDKKSFCLCVCVSF